MNVNTKRQGTPVIGSAQQWVSDLLNGLFHDIASDCHIAMLANAMYSIDSLGFNHGIPLGLNEVYTACAGKINTEIPMLLVWLPSLGFVN
jgi:hypothetical protein